MESHELLALVLHGREERNLEYKRRLSWNDTKVRPRITKSILSMCNIRDGGTIVVGVEQRGEAFQPTGMVRKDLESFTQDGVSSHVNEFADPFVEVTISRVSNGRSNFIVIQVQEFAELPVVCKRDGPAGLRRGAIYTRTRRMNESAEVPSQAEMREILDLAVEKGIRVFQSRLGRAGLEVAEPVSVDREKFEAELKGL